MISYTVKLLDKHIIAKSTMAFRFEKPVDYVYKPGQYIDVTLIEPPETDAEGNTRSFSLTSIPFDDFLSIATRLRNTAFKRIIKDAAQGYEFQISQPQGSFTLHNDIHKSAVFLAGGIGITPFHSMLKSEAQNNFPHAITLFYSNRIPEDAAFIDEIDRFAAENHNFTYVPVVTRPDQAPEWQGEKGYIEGKMIKKYISDITTPIFYIAGPPEMVKAIHKTINELGVNDDMIRSEDFAGY